MNDILRSLRELDALTRLSVDRLHVIDQLQPVIEQMRQREQMMRPAIEAVQRYEDTMRPMLDAARRYEDAMRPIVEAARERQDMFRRMSEALPVNAPALALASQVQLPQMQLIESLGKTMALNGVFDQTRGVSDWTESWRAAFDQFNDLTKLVPNNAFADMQRMAESVRMSMPDFPVLDSSLLGATLTPDLFDAVQRFRNHAESVANDADASVEDVEALVVEAQAVNAVAPAEVRSCLNGYMLLFFFWLLDKAAEDPAKELIHNALGVLILVLTTITPPDLPPRPEPEVAQIAVPTTPSWLAAGLPDIVHRAGPDAERITLGFLSSIRNINTRQAYEAAVERFAEWCDDRDLDLIDITPFVVQAYVKQMQHEYATGTVKQHLAAIRLLFDHLVVGAVLPVNPPAAVRSPRKGTQPRTKTPPLQPDEARVLLRSIHESDRSAVRDRALLGIIACSTPRASSVVAMDVKDYVRDDGNRRLRLRERNGAFREAPVDHTTEKYLDAYLNIAAVADQPESPLWRTMTKERGFSERRMSRVDVFRMIRRRTNEAAHAATLNLPAKEKQP